MLSALPRLSMMANVGRIMKMDEMQTIVLCALFAVLGAALYYQWVSSPRNRGKYSSRRRWLTVFAAALVVPAGWLIMNRAQGFLPHGWASWVLIVALGLMSIFAKPPADVSASERAATRRIQVGILIGGAILVAICMIIFRPSRW